MSHKHADDAIEVGECSPECLFTSEPVQDPYSSDEEKDSCRKERKKTSPVKGLFLHNFSSSLATGEELVHFLDFSYVGVESKVDEYSCSVNELFEETLNFAFPDGVPDFYFNIKNYVKTSVEKGGKISWKKVAAYMLTDFFEEDHVKWLHENHTLDYTNPTQEELNRQLQVLKTGSALEFKKKKNKKVFKASGLAIKMHSLLEYFAEERKTDPDRSKSEKYDYVKDIFYCMTSILDITTQINGAAVFDFHHLYIPGLITSKPDATFNVPLTVGTYPYCAVEVYGPYFEDVLQSVSSGSSAARSPDCDADSDSDDESVCTPLVNAKLKKLSLEKRHSCKRGIEFYNDDQMLLRKEYKHDIAAESPLNAQDLRLALKKSTGQLPLEMFGVLIAQEKIRMKLLSENATLTQEKNSYSLGLFVMNEYIYLENIELKSSVLRSITLDDRTGLKTNKSKCLDHTYTKNMEGPKVYLTKWCFDLKKPNHRAAFLGFLYFYSDIATSQVVIPD